MRRRLLVLFPLSLLLAACGGSSSTPRSGGPVQQTIQISEKEYSLTPAMEIEGNGVEEKTGDLQPATSATLRVTLTKNGSYELYWPID